MPLSTFTVTSSVSFHTAATKRNLHPPLKTGSLPQVEPYHIFYFLSTPEPEARQWGVFSIYHSTLAGRVGRGRFCPLNRTHVPARPPTRPLGAFVPWSASHGSPPDADRSRRSAARRQLELMSVWAVATGAGWSRPPRIGERWRSGKEKPLAGQGQGFGSWELGAGSGQGSPATSFNSKSSASASITLVAHISCNSSTSAKASTGSRIPVVSSAALSQIDTVGSRINSLIVV